MAQQPTSEIPLSSRTGIHWPAAPIGMAAELLAIHIQLDRSQWWSADQIRISQFRQLAVLLEYAKKHSPLYADRIGDAGSLDEESWAKLPVLTRQDVQIAGETLFSSEIPPDHGAQSNVQTSGSTGRPIIVKNTALTELFRAAIGLRYNLWHGRDFSGKLAAIRNLSPELAVAADARNVGGWMRGLSSGPAVLFNITQPIDQQLDWLIAEDPDYLLTFPSNLAALLHHSEKIGRRPSKLQQVVTMSEMVEPALRARCQADWGVGLTDSYSSEEAGYMALQCPTGNHYHAQSEVLMLEVLDAQGHACTPGEIGRIVVTPLHNFASPLIRYEIGDYAEVGPPCECGRGLPSLSRIVGRTRNMLHLPGDGMMWPSFPEEELMRIAPVRQFQITQTAIGKFEAKLVLDADPTAAQATTLEAYLRHCLRDPTELTLNYVNEIARAAGGKYEDFISHVGT